MKKETVVRQTWIGRTLVVCSATFVGGKNTSIEIKEYDGDKTPKL